MFGKRKNIDREKDEIYCKICGGCGEVGCDGIATFLHKHVRGKTDCLYEESYIEDIIEMYKEMDTHSAHLVERNKKLMLHLSVVLPMAKGYVHTHDVGRNREMVSNAEDYLAELEADQRHSSQP
jgi:hypothetical protein